MKAFFVAAACCALAGCGPQLLPPGSHSPRIAVAVGVATALRAPAPEPTPAPDPPAKCPTCDGRGTLGDYGADCPDCELVAAATLRDAPLRTDAAATELAPKPAGSPGLAILPKLEREAAPLVWLDGWAEALTISEQQRRPVLLLVTRQGCAPCAAVQAALDDPTVTRWIAANCVPCRLSADRGGLPVPIRAQPTIVVFFGRVRATQERLPHEPAELLAVLRQTFDEARHK